MRNFLNFGSGFIKQRGNHQRNKKVVLRMIKIRKIQESSRGRENIIKKSILRKI